MSLTVKVDLSGFKKGLEKMQKAARDQALLDALEAGARVIQGNAQANVEANFSGKATGALSNSIIVETSGGGTKAEAQVGPTAIYGRIHELGGVIMPVTAKALHWVDDDGNDVFAGSVTIPARPYLRPAVDGHEDEIKGEVAKSLKQSIDEALR